VRTSFEPTQLAASATHQQQQPAATSQLAQPLPYSSRHHTDIAVYID